MTQPRIAVVGGGMAGLMAALRLRESGAVPTVFEAAETPGGMIRTVRREGWTLELGASFVTATPELRSLLDRAGPLPPTVQASGDSQRRFLVHAGRVVPVPESPAELVASPLLSIAGRMRFLKEPFVARGVENPEETMASFTRRRFGEEAAATIFDPRASGTTGGDPEQLLARYTFPAEVEYERRAGSVLKGRMRAARAARREGPPSAAASPWSCAGGLGALPLWIAESLGSGYCGGRRVDVIRQVEPGRLQLQGGDLPLGEFDGVVLAVSAPALGRIRIELPGAEGIVPVVSMPHASLAVVALGYRREDIRHPLDGHGLLAASSERRRLLGAQFTSTQFLAHAPAGHVLVTVSLGGARAPTVVTLGDNELLEMAHGEMEQLLGAVTRPVISEVARWPNALPLAVSGHRARLEAAHRFEQDAPRIAFAGTWRDGLMLRDVMQGGVEAATRLLARLPPSPDVREGAVV